MKSITRAEDGQSISSTENGMHKDKEGSEGKNRRPSAGPYLLCLPVSLGHSYKLRVGLVTLQSPSTSTLTWNH